MVGSTWRSAWFTSWVETFTSHKALGPGGMLSAGLLLESSAQEKLSLDDSRTTGGRSTSERSLNTPASSQSPATYENSNVVIFEVRFLDCF
ncbi:hypothetical protein XENOCAPTIV_009753 [Xenoophorus captivus]|uniref:Uncharacterized protein n=1 Tax=Xenoophorus captivus TaxID=1517983 RepID=A0ABV0RPV5_9TELE